jgi:hypothetical protein
MTASSPYCSADQSIIDLIDQSFSDSHRQTAVNLGYRPTVVTSAMDAECPPPGNGPAPPPGSGH